MSFSPMICLNSISTVRHRAESGTSCTPPSNGSSVLSLTLSIIKKTQEITAANGASSINAISSVSVRQPLAGRCCLENVDKRQRQQQDVSSDLILP
jgi:hypothetical protein